MSSPSVAIAIELPGQTYAALVTLAERRESSLAAYIATVIDSGVKLRVASMIGRIPDDSGDRQKIVEAQANLLAKKFLKHDRN